VSWIDSLERARQELASCRWDNCHGLLEQALEEVQETAQRAVVLNNLGMLFRKIADLDQAEACFEQALECQPEAGLAGRIRANWAVLQHRRGHFRAARKLYQEALVLCSEPSEDELAVARICLNFSWLHLQQGRKAQAETMIKRARGIVQSLPEQEVLQSRLHLGLGRCALEQGRLTKAEVELLQAIRVAQRMRQFDPIIHSQARALLAQIYSRQAVEQLAQKHTEQDGQKRCNQAEMLFVESLMMLDDWGQKLTLEYAENLSLQVDHWIRLQDWERAEIWLQKLLLLAGEMKSLDAQMKASAWERASKVLHQLHKHELAAQALVEFQTLSKVKR